jgi:hypothetical protein
MAPRPAVNRRQAVERPVRAGRISKTKKEQGIIKGDDVFVLFFYELVYADIRQSHRIIWKLLSMIKLLSQFTAHHRPGQRYANTHLFHDLYSIYTEFLARAVNNFVMRFHGFAALKVQCITPKVSAMASSLMLMVAPALTSTRKSSLPECKYRASRITCLY